MGVTRQAGGAYATRLCPRCGSELYADMSVCYGCLYDFTRAPARPGPEGEAPPAAGDTLDLGAVPQAARHMADRVGVLVRTASVDLWAPVGEGGLTLGRDPSNDVVLHSPAVSRRHLRLEPTPDGMEVLDLGSTNPATYRGREVDRVVVPYGEALDVCGCLLVVTGPAASTA